MHKVCHWELVNELAQQGHLLIRHDKGLKCKVCNVYRADRQFSFWRRTPCIPRPCAAEVISQSRNKKRQHNAYKVDSAFSDKESSVSQNSQSTHSLWIDSPSLCLLSLHTLNNSVLVTLLLKSVSSVTEVGMFQCVRVVVAWLARAAKWILPKGW